MMLSALRAYERGLLLLFFITSPAAAYIESVHTMPMMITQSSNIVELRVEKVDKEKNLIIYRKVRDIKGTHPGETVKHNIGRGGFHPREWQNIMAWAEVGKPALFFYAGAAGECCIENYWYQVYAGDWWVMSHAEPYLLRTFAGRPDKLATAVAAMIRGQEVVVPCMVDGDKNAIQLRTARVQRLRASLKLADYNPKRDFAGWGAEDFRPILDMPGFTHIAALPRTDLAAGGIAPADFDGDGKLDFCMYGQARTVLLQNSGGLLSEQPLGLDEGSHWAGWGDCNSDGWPDLLAATASGPRLMLNLKTGFREASANLPRQPYYNLSAAAWIDCDSDGNLDIVVADGFTGLRLYRNNGGDAAALAAAGAKPPPPAPAAPVPPGAAAKPSGPPPAPPGAPTFQDVSDQFGLGEHGVAASLKGDALIVADVNGDGRPDVLFNAGGGVLLINTPKGFVAARDSGLAYAAGAGKPIVGDVDGDGAADVLVPQGSTCKLFRNDGKGHFSDVTAKAGDLAKPMGQVVCVAWANWSAKKPNPRPDIVVGCLKAPNRCFRNNGDGSFTDVSEQLGLSQRIFNTRGLCVADVNNDGWSDLLLNNEAQESAVLLGRGQ